MVDNNDSSAHVPVSNQNALSSSDQHQEIAETNSKIKSEKKKFLGLNGLQWTGIGVIIAAITLFVTIFLNQ